KGQLMKSLHTAFSFAPPSILSLTIYLFLSENGQFRNGTAHISLKYAIFKALHRFKHHLV
ncbi:hypothetical protein ABHC48_04395, partial [Ruminococcus sp. 1001136sp1]|uniref:hypothetical protein n=1 Tax=Ruminococcus sp. 1001136sp1 TaxID=2986996 RepID=UPI002330AC0F